MVRITSLVLRHLYLNQLRTVKNNTKPQYSKPRQVYIATTAIKNNNRKFKAVWFYDVAVSYNGNDEELHRSNRAWCT